MQRRFTRRDFLEKGWKSCLYLGGTALSLSCLLRSSHSHASKNPEVLYEARFYEKLPHQKVRCHLCFRGCEILEGKRGFCRNRENIKGTLYSMVYGRPAALQVDPIEKEPSFHMIPGSHIFCTATASCNFRCKFCQNWHLSQRSMEEIPYVNLKPEEIVQKAIREHCETVSFTYSEPTVFYEYMFDIVKIAKDRGLKTLFHTNGSMSTDPLLALLKYMDGVTVDLKAFSEKFYGDVSSSELEPVLHTLRTVKSYGRYLEIVNLMIPTLNDNPHSVPVVRRRSFTERILWSLHKTSKKGNVDFVAIPSRGFGLNIPGQFFHQLLIDGGVKAPPSIRKLFLQKEVVFGEKFFVDLRLFRDVGDGVLGVQLHGHKPCLGDLRLIIFHIHRI